MIALPNFVRLACVLPVMAITVVPRPTLPAEALVAVAANFVEVSEDLKRRFEAGSPHTIKLTSGSTGQLYAQIVNGAPFDLLLAADGARPQRLVEGGDAVAGSRFTYATGRLTLWSADADLVGDHGVEVLKNGAFRTLAIANPALAPYGVAAEELLVNLGVDALLGAKIVKGQSVSQVFSMVATGNAEVGLVALSQVLGPRHRTLGSRWDVPLELYTPIRQDAVLLTRGADNPAAREFLRFLRSRDARAQITLYGYGTE